MPKPSVSAPSLAPTPFYTDMPPPTTVNQGRGWAMGRWLRRFDVWVWTAAIYALLAALAPLLTGKAPAPGVAPSAVAGEATVGATARSPLVRLATPILRYRGVTADNGGGSALSLARLEEHLEALKADGIVAVGLGQVLDALEVRTVLPEHAVALAFDADRSTTVTAALPALVHRQMTATFFVAPQQLGQPGAPTNAQVRALAAAGMDIAPLASLPDSEQRTGHTEALAERLMALRGGLLGLGVHPLP
ncbi:MAG: polysaccharide deacetylase family protein, partial [Chloroflexi bacterium]|nr:polysaccharide deacetylase family protein [Chloroflexota bacterium]